MKPLYLLSILYALFITGLSDGIAFALAPIPVLGIIFAFTITFCLNITMGAGLIALLASHGMFHSKWGPLAVVGGFIPGFNFLPFWLGLVAAGIAQDMSKQKGLLGTLAKTATAAQPGGNIFVRASAVASAVQPNERRATGRPPAPAVAEENEPQEEEAPARAPLNLKSPGMHSDIIPHAQTV